MVQTLAIAETVKTLAEAESRLNLRPATDPAFFTEWSDSLPTISEADQARLNLIKQRYLYHRKNGYLAEGTVNFIVMAPLLELAGINIIADFPRRL
ncbi:MAG: hypothetical protein AAGC54_13600 [Cyanobacteria bacterium P01_F01_bin.4]